MQGQTQANSTLRKELAETQQQLQQKDERIKELERELAEERQKNKPVRATSLPSCGDKVVRELTGFEVTWYNDTGTTRSGRRTQDGVTVSVDPRVIPLGTWIELEFPDGTVLTRRADDTGGAVKGKVVDVYANAPTSELLKRGRKKGVTVRIIGKE